MNAKTKARIGIEMRAGLRSGGFVLLALLSNAMAFLR
jgi:hypothetical protein